MALVLQLGIATYGLHRLGLMSTGLAMPLLGVAVLGAGAALVLALLSLWRIWKVGGNGAATAGTAATLAMLVLGGAGVAAAFALSFPAINDVTTDPVDPPRFDILSNRRPADANPTRYNPALAETQLAALPDIVPVATRRSAGEAYDLARSVAGKLNWQVVAAGAPGEGGPFGEIEAIDKTLIMGFVDDIAIRITPIGQTGSRIDIRSASRYGHTDIGRNADRIRTFLNEIRRAIEAGELTTSG